MSGDCSVAMVHCMEAYDLHLVDMVRGVTVNDSAPSTLLKKELHPKINAFEDSCLEAISALKHRLCGHLGSSVNIDPDTIKLPFEGGDTTGYLRPADTLQMHHYRKSLLFLFLGKVVKAQRDLIVSLRETCINNSGTKYREYIDLTFVASYSDEEEILVDEQDNMEEMDNREYVIDFRDLRELILGDPAFKYQLSMRKFYKKVIHSLHFDNHRGVQLGPVEHDVHPMYPEYY